MASKENGLRQRATNGHSNGKTEHAVKPTDEGRKTDERLDQHLEYVPAVLTLKDAT